MAERRGPLSRLRRSRGRAVTTSAWQEVPDAVPLDDVAAAAELAAKASTPFGFKRPAHELLRRFGGDTPDARRRAAAALALAGIAADPPLETADPFQFVQLRPAEPNAAPTHSEPPAPSFAPPVPPPEAPGSAFAPPVPPPAPPADPAPPPSPRRRSLRPADIAARHAPTGPVTRERRFAAGALGLVALLVLLLAVVLLRGVIGSPDSGGNALQALTTSTAPAATTTAEAAPSPPPRAVPRTPARPATVRLRIVPTEPSFVCVANGRSGATLWEGRRTAPYTVRRPRLILRVGATTARIEVDGRPLRIARAQSAYALSPRGVRRLTGARAACGA